MQKYKRSYFASLATKLIKSIAERGFREWSRPGIRAKLIDTRSHKLVMDFVGEGDGGSTRILDAISPAFTCSFPFPRYVIKNHIRKDL